MKIILAGNPNTGKTTLFNTLSHSREHASNWHGVTVEVKQKPFKYEGKEFVLCDLPGLYSLEGYSEEERIASEFIEKSEGAVVVCIADANNLRRNLYLALELKERVSELILAVNMASEVKGLDSEKLEKEFGVKVFLIDARKRKTLKALMEYISNSRGQKPLPASRAVEPLDKIEARAKSRFAYIDKGLERAGYARAGYYGFSKLDKMLLNPVLGFLTFALVMGLVFFLTFGAPGAFLSGLIGGLFERLFSGVVALLSRFVSSEALLMFIEKGIFGGALSVLGFLPQIVLLFLCLNFLEDVGYLSRVALLFDGVLKRLGLTGRSVFSLIMGFGCTTTAVMTTRGQDSAALKRRTAIFLPFMSCSAKLPIYAVICSVFFTKHKALMVFLLYMLGIGLMTLLALLTRPAQSRDTFMLELPKFRLPNAQKVVKNAFSSAADFFVRVGGILVLASIVVFLLGNFSLDLRFIGIEGGKSILDSVAGWLAVVFTPLGFGMTGAVVAVLSGFVAKEMVISSLAIVNGVATTALAESLAVVGSPVHFTPLSAISFLVFVLLYPPCISAFLSMKREVGLKVALRSFFLQLGLAYVMSALVYNLGRLAMGNLWWLSLLILSLLALSLLVVVKYVRKKKRLALRLSISCVRCQEGCNGCNNL